MFIDFIWITSVIEGEVYQWVLTSHSFSGEFVRGKGSV